MVNPEKRKLAVLLTVSFVLSVLFVPALAISASAQDSQCALCHTDGDKLRAILGQKEQELPTLMTPALSRPLETLPLYGRVLVDPKLFEDENHGITGCEECHGGNPEEASFEKAHQGVVKDPAPDKCLDCHDYDKYEQSLHYTAAGMTAPVLARASEAAKGKLNEAMTGQCTSCHASCGQCHVSRPNAAGGGLVQGHTYLRIPDQEQNCAGCHGARAGDEFFGRNPGAAPDFHNEEGAMQCTDCHGGERMHGQTEKRAACLDCHQGIYEKEAENVKVHSAHQGKAACQVCHAQAYRNCNGCHLDARQGTYALDGHDLNFKIGFNPSPNDQRPEKFVVLRRVPVAEKTFDSYFEGALANFRELPTWKPASPHNIVRVTEQAKECNNCHSNPKMFLLRKDVEPEHVKANRSVIVPPAKVPIPIT